MIRQELESRAKEIEKLKELGYSMVEGAIDFSGKQAVDENQQRLNSDRKFLKIKVDIKI